MKRSTKFGHSRVSGTDDHKSVWAGWWVVCGAAVWGVSDHAVFINICTLHSEHIVNFILI